MTDWRPVPDFPGYEVSDDGQVKSWKRGTVRILRPNADRAGYPYVCLRRDGVTYTRKIHVLVALAFHGPRPFADAHIRHLDGDPANKTPANLRYGTASENQYDKVAHGRHHNASRTHCKHGHPYDEANTKVIKSRPNSRLCRACETARNAVRDRRKKAVA